MLSASASAIIVTSGGFVSLAEVLSHWPDTVPAIASAFNSPQAKRIIDLASKMFLIPLKCLSWNVFNLVKEASIGF